jgi:hypothetical protein
MLQSGRPESLLNQIPIASRNLRQRRAGEEIRLRFTPDVGGGDVLGVEIVNCALRCHESPLVVNAHISSEQNVV